MPLDREVFRISRNRAIEFLQNETEGRVFSAYFQKKDGSMREMNCRRGVKAYLKGGSLPYDARAKMLLPVFDMQKQEYRTINFGTLVSFNIGGETFILA